MIVKKIEPKEGVKPSFAGLANYITDEQGKDNRVGNVVIHNCVDNDDFDIALIDIDSFHSLLFPTYLTIGSCLSS